MAVYACGRLWLALSLWASTSVVLVQSVMTPIMPLSFFFDWNPPGQRYPVPVTAQCETLHIVWEKGAAWGPDPVGPYYLQVYTSIYFAPIIIPVGDVQVYDWAVPFPPGTLYEICMFDKNGNTGGCQATYTVIPATTAPTCANVTLPPLLGVDAVVNNGPMSRYGWIEQCTDIALTPTNGTPPYILTVAPSLRPPYNLTSSGKGSFNWTVTLPWSMPFFLGVSDSAGNMWANGLLHAGTGDNTACLSSNTAPGIGHHMVKPAIAIGAGAGGLAVGLLILVVVLFFLRRRRLADRSMDLLKSGPSTAGGTSSMRNRQAPSAAFRGLRGLSLRNPNRLSAYNIEPFTLPGEGERLGRDSLSPLTIGTGRTLSGDSSSNGMQNQVYVVHHDGQAPPVTIYHEGRTRVVELPPMYPRRASSGREGMDEAYGGEGRSSDSKSDGEPADAPPSRRILREHRRPTVSKKPPSEAEIME